MLRKKAESSTNSNWRVSASALISLRRNQSSKASGRKWPMSMISVACPLMTAEPSTPIGLLGGGRRGRADRLGDAVRVDDQDHRAVAEDRVAREHRDVAQLGRHRLHDDFLGVEHAVHHDAESLIADLRDDDETVFRI